MYFPLASSTHSIFIYKFYFFPFIFNFSPFIPLHVPNLLPFLSYQPMFTYLSGFYLFHTSRPQLVSYIPFLLFKSVLILPGPADLLLLE